MSNSILSPAVSSTAATATRRANGETIWGYGGGETIWGCAGGETIWGFANGETIWG